MSLPEDYAPLFEPGIFKISIDEIKSYFVSPFEKSQIREAHTRKLLNYIDTLRSIGISFDIWLDGSYCTNKEEPNDIDLLFVASGSELMLLTEEKRSKLSGLLDNAYCKSAFNCDVYFAQREDAPLISYWRGWYGFKRDGVTAKGIAVIEVRNDS